MGINIDVRLDAFIIFYRRSRKFRRYCIVDGSIPDNC